MNNRHNIDRGKTTIVTGAAHGIGKGIALTLAEAGTDIVSGDLHTEENDRLPVEIQALGRPAAPREIGLLAVYLASEASDMVTGQKSTSTADLPAQCNRR